MHLRRTDVKAVARDKIRQLHDLAACLAGERAAGRTVVLCHGVFDLLHLGHIRHFEQARQLGDVLVVTLTPDRYVNKGPHRPAFTEYLRAEAIAALECVDFVAINEWPMAVETIGLLRPNVYVKGSDYRNAADDCTGGIALERAAVESVGGMLVFTDEITFSASGLLNRHSSVLSAEARQFLERFRARFDASGVIGYLEELASLRVLVVGEAIVDEYQYCEAIGKSSKEPILAVKRLSTETFAGGILALANHLADFAGEVGLVSFLGSKDSREAFVRENLDDRITTTLLFRSNAPTIVKRRFIESYFFMKMLEVYEIDDGMLSADEDRALGACLRERVRDYDVVVVVDFGHGMLTPNAIDILVREAKFLAVNAQSNAGNLGYHTISRYPRADYACMTEGEIRLEARDRGGDLPQMAAAVAERHGYPRLVVTRGRHGCLCYDRATGVVEVPAFAGQVVDRMGAGDAFLALTAPCVARGVPLDVVGFVGNVVGAQAVATVGHRKRIDRVGLYRQIESLLK